MNLAFQPDLLTRARQIRADATNHPDKDVVDACRVIIARSHDAGEIRKAQHMLKLVESEQ